MTENQKSWIFAVAVAMVFVLVSCVSVASASDIVLDADTVGGVIYVTVPNGYFDGIAPYSGSVDVGSISVSWGNTRSDNTASVSLSASTTGRLLSLGYMSSSASSVPVQTFESSPTSYYIRPGSSTATNQLCSLFNSQGKGSYTLAGSYSLYYLLAGSSNYVRFKSGGYDFTIPSAVPTPTPTTPRPTTPSVPDPVISKFTIFPTYAYQSVLLDVSLVGTGGVSASAVPSSGSPVALSQSGDDTWTGHISFGAVGTYTVYGTLTNSVGKTVSSGEVTIHIVESPKQPIIHNTSVTYDMGYDHPVITTYVTYPVGVIVYPDTCFFINWGDGSTSYYEGFIDGVPQGYPIYVVMSHEYTSEGIYTATVNAQNNDGTASANVGINISPMPTPTTPEPTPTTPEPTPTTPEPTSTTPEPTATTPEPTITTPAPTGTYPTPTFTIPTPITTVVIPTYDLDPYNPLGLGIASPGGEPPASPAFPALVLPNLNILEGWGQNTSWSGLYNWYDGVVGSIVDPLGSAWAELMGPLVQYVVEVAAGVTSLFVAVSTWIYPAVAFIWEVSAYIYALVPLVVWICIAAMLWILVLALLIRLLSEPVWMIIRDLFGGRR